MMSTLKKVSFYVLLLCAFIFRNVLLLCDHLILHLMLKFYIIGLPIFYTFTVWVKLVICSLIVFICHLLWLWQNEPMFYWFFKWNLWKKDNFCFCLSLGLSIITNLTSCRMVFITCYQQVHLPHSQSLSVGACARLFSQSSIWTWCFSFIFILYIWKKLLSFTSHPLS